MKLRKRTTSKSVEEWNARDFFNFFRRKHEAALGFEYPKPLNSDGWRAACVFFQAFQSRHNLSNEEFRNFLAYTFDVLDANSFDGIRSVLNVNALRSFRKHHKKRGSFAEKARRLYEDS